MRRLLITLFILCPLFSISPLFAATLDQAIHKEEAGDYEGAQAIYEDILKKDPQNEKAFFGLAGVFYWEGNYQKSLETYLKLLEKNPNHVDAMLGASKVYLAMGNQHKAQEYLAKAQKIEPENKEAKELKPQIAQKTRLLIDAGYTFYDRNYDTNSQAQFEEIEISKEKTFGLGVKSTYFRKFERNSFNTELFGNYYLKEKTRIDAGLSFAPSVNILPRQSYTVGLAETIWKITPEIHYLFQDFSQAKLHFIRPAVYVEPFSFLRVGGGYELHRLSAGTNTRNFKGGFANIKISPLEWLSFRAFYEHFNRGFEGGRAPIPFITYSADFGGGGIELDFLASYSIHFYASAEKRSNGDTIEAYTFSLGANF